MEVAEIEQPGPDGKHANDVGERRFSGKALGDAKANHGVGPAHEDAVYDGDEFCPVLAESHGPEAVPDGIYN